MMMMTRIMMVTIKAITIKPQIIATAMKLQSRVIIETGAGETPADPQR